MTTAAQLISKLGTKGIKLWLDDEQQLRFKAPKGALNSELKSQLIAQKADIISFLIQAKGENLSHIQATSRKQGQDFALSYSQQRFWFLDKLSPGDPSLHIPQALELTGSFNLACFNEALSRLFEKHEALRTFFIINDANEPRQIVHPETSLTVEQDYDLSDLSSSQQKERIAHLMRDESTQPFDLNQAPSSHSPFFRIKLAKLHKGENTQQQHYVLLLCLHHIIADGWSLNILMNELADFYNACLLQQTISPAQAALQYIDFSEHQHKWMQTEQKNQQLQYWQQQCDGIEILNLPTDYERPKHLSHHGNNIHFTVNAATSKALHNISQEQKLSFFSLMLASFNALLMRYSGQEDICIGTPSANRHLSGIENTLGCFINLLSIRSQINPEENLLNLAKQVQNTLLSAQQHQDIPFDLVAEHCNPHRSNAHTPIFQVLFTLRNSVAENPFRFEQLHIDSLPQQSVSAKYDLQLHIDEHHDELHCQLEYNSDLFSPAYIQAFADHFTQLLNSFSAKPQQAISQLALYSEQQLSSYKQAVNQHSTADLQQALQHQLSTSPNAIAVNDGKQQLSFAQLHSKADAIAEALLNNGVQPEDPIGIYLSASSDAVAAILAVIKVAACYVPIDTNYPGERIQHMQQQGQFKAVLSNSQLQANTPFNMPVICLDEINTASQPRSIFIAAKPSQALYLIFTSGSTGKPKAAAVSYANEMNLLPWYISQYGMSAQSKVLVISSLGFDLTQKNLLAPLISGAEIHFDQHSYYEPASICKTITQRAINWLNCAPSAFYPLVEYCQHSHSLASLNNITELFLGGEAIQIERLEPWLLSEGFQTRITNMYGPTECTDITSSHTLENPLDYLGKNIPIGKAIAGVQCFIVDANQQLLPQGAIGELYIGGPSVGLGYVNNPENTQSQFVQLPFYDGLLYRTHDIVQSVDHKGEQLLRFLSRSDDQIKIRGFRVELGEINHQITLHNAIDSAFVTPIVNSNKQTQLAAYLTVNNHDDIHTLKTALRSQLSQSLPDYMIPSAFIVLDALPLSPNGKIDRKALPAPKDNDFIKTAFVAPSSLTEKQLAELFAQRLNIEVIGVDDNFFELGGHSLLATQLLGDISQTFGIDISLKTFFENPRLISLGKIIDNGGELETLQQYPDIPAADRTQNIPLSFAQQRLWIIEQLNPGNSAYNIAAALLLEGQVNIQAIELALTSLVQRHESLRTRIINNSQGEAIQLIEPASQFTMAAIACDNRQAANSLFNDFANQAFDVNHEVLFKAQLATISEQQVMLMINMHHLISDGWSTALLQKEFLHYYQLHCNKALAALETLPIQYADFSLWQQTSFKTEQAEQQIDFWVKQLHDAPAKLHLPIDFKRPETQIFNGSSYNNTLSTELSDNTRTLARNIGSTPFNILLSVFALLLNKHCQQDDICIGTPVSGRDNPALQNLIGFFVNAVVLRCKLQGKPSFIQLLERIQDTSLAAFAHQDTPIEQVLDKLPLERDLSHAPVAQVGFSFISEQFTKQTQLDELNIEYISPEQQSAKYDLTLIVLDHGETFELCFEYNVDLFKAETMALFAEHFQQLLESCLSNTQQTISEIDLLSPTQIMHAAKVANPETTTIHKLSPMQHDLVAHQKLQAETLANTLGYNLQINFAVDIEVWRKTLTIIAQHFDVCRTQFIDNPLHYGEFAYQAVQQEAVIDLEVIDKRHEAFTEENKQQWVNDFIYQPEQYLKQRYLRYGVLQVAGDKTIFLLSAHHAILDGISIVLLGQKSSQVYDALIADEDPKLALKEEENNFTHFITEQRKCIDTADVENFWQETLSDCEPLSIASQTDKITHKQIVSQHKLDKEHWDSIKQFCRSKRMTISQYFKWLYALLIKQYCQSDASFYLTEFTNGRSKDYYQSVGCFFDQSPFIVPSNLFDNDCSVDDLFTYTRQYRKQIKPYNQISSGLTQRLTSSQGLKFMYNFYHFLPNDETLQGESVNCIEMPPFVDNTVQLVVKELEDSLGLDLYYQQENFNELRFLQRMESISAQILKGQENIHQLSYVLNDEYSQQRFEYNRPIERGESYPNSLMQQFEQQVQQQGENIACFDSANNTGISYQQLNARANQLARYLKQHSAGSHNHIAICLPRGINALIAILASIKSGSAYIPIDSSLPLDRIEQIIEISEASLLISETAINLSNENCDALLFNGSSIHRSTEAETPLDSLSSENIVHHSDLNDLLYIIFTSGSTGIPKGACVSHKGELNLLRWYTQCAQFSPESKTLIISALGFDLTQKNLFAPLVTGGSIVFGQTQYDSEHILNTIAQQQITHINCAPSAFYPLVEDHKQPELLTSLQQLIFGGEAIQLERLSLWCNSEYFHSTITNHYGPTECTDIALYHCIEQPQAYYQTDVPMGKPNDGVQVFIVNEQLQLLPSGVTGEICIAGQSVGQGYLHNSELNQEKFVANPFGEGQLYRSGDLGRYLDNGDISFVGRKDFQVKINGLRIELEEIEHRIKQQAYVNDALVIADDEKLIAYACGNKAQIDSQAWPQQLAKHLPSYMIPNAFIVLDSWPLNNNGKIDRKQLPKPESIVSTVPYVAPRDEVEQEICDIIERILQLPKVGVHDNFFDLGGHSLAASRAIVQIREKYNTDIPLNLLFDMTTVEKLASYIKASQWAQQSASDNQADDENRDTGFI